MRMEGAERLRILIIEDGTSYVLDSGMDKQELMVKVAAVLTALAETNSGTPESMLYILCDMDMSKWEILRHVLLGAGFVTIKGNFVTLTESGKETAIKLESVIK